MSKAWYMQMKDLFYTHPKINRLMHADFNFLLNIFARIHEDISAVRRFVPETALQGIKGICRLR